MLNSNVINWGRVKAIIFDLDGTLYCNKQLIDRYDQVFEAFISDKLCIEQSQVKEGLYKISYCILDSFKFKPSRVTLLPALGLDINEWYSYSLKNINPHDYLDCMPALAKTLDAIDLPL